MELVVKELINHKYSLDELECNWAIETLKDANVELNEKGYKSHTYIEDIKENDIVLSIRWREKNEDYAYFFFKCQSIESGILYIFTKSIIETGNT